VGLCVEESARPELAGGNPGRAVLNAGAAFRGRGIPSYPASDGRSFMLEDAGVPTTPPPPPKNPTPPNTDPSFPRVAARPPPAALPLLAGRRELRDRRVWKQRWIGGPVPPPSTHADREAPAPPLRESTPRGTHRSRPQGGPWCMHGLAGGGRSRPWIGLVTSNRPRLRRDSASSCRWRPYGFDTCASATSCAALGSGRNAVCSPSARG
jgi:hypothetical protein